MLRTVVRFCFVAALIASLSAPANGREGRIGTVKGAEALYVREGPGTEHAAFETLLKGAQVEVQSVEGSWATVRTASGRTGYVHATFLELHDEANAQPPDVPPPTPAPAAPPVAEEAAPPPEQDPAAGQVAFASEPAARREAPPAAASAPGKTDAGDELLWDVKRILRLTEEMHGELAKRPGMAEGSTQVVEDSSGAPGVASTLALSGIGIIFGFLVGSLYGRRVERNRRTRVRF